jgi:pyruvate formate lyase activating enzyme
MDAINIDIKGNEGVYEKYCGNVDVDKIWRNIREIKNLGMHVEVVNLIITNVNDSEGSIMEVIEKHVKNAGPKTPLHFTRYFPAYKFKNPPTKIGILERAYEMAKESGVLYPYIGNVLGHPYENTYCPNCGRLLIERDGFSARIKGLKDEKCDKCGQEIPIIL